MVNNMQDAMTEDPLDDALLSFTNNTVSQKHARDLFTADDR